MPIDAERLSQHYASLTNDELSALARSELTELAQKCFDREIQRRGLSLTKPESIESGVEQPDSLKPQVKPDPDFEDEPFVVCSWSNVRFISSEAADANAALQAAGIPSRIESKLIDPGSAAADPYTEYQLVVPSRLTLHAASVLDKTYFNPTMEAEWKTHLASLSDEDFNGINVDDICAGLLDRAARLRNAYLDEVRHRSKIALSAKQGDLL